jgi:hypothetical protein
MTAIDTVLHYFTSRTDCSAKDQVEHVHFCARRLLFLAATLFGASICWMAEHPPMGDLAQHAGQVILLRDVLRGTSPWSDLVRINVFTPYLVGYGLALPLSLVFPIGVAIKVLLSAAYIAFVIVAVKIRAYLGADPRMDWLFLPSFFGFAWAWGFLTFLVAAPLAMVMIYVSDQHARRVTPQSSGVVLIVGMLLLMSHGLAFCFGWAVAVALVVAYQRSPKTLVVAMAPLLLLLVPFAGYALYSQKLNLELQGVTPPSEIAFEYSVRRVNWALRDSLTGTYERFFTFPALFLLAMPWLMGLRIGFGVRSRWVPFAVTVLVLMLVPSLALGTWGLYPRFALFLLPTYAWMFVPRVANVHSKRSYFKTRAGISEAALALTCLALLSLNGFRTVKFDSEEADFRNILKAVQPGERALSLVYDRSSEASHHQNMYAHTVLWYQAEKQGFVDFNFAWYPPQIVRFRQGKTPMIHIDFESHPEQFQWVRDQGEIYRYFFVRTLSPLVFDPFAGALCRPALIATSGKWLLFERRLCQ